MKLRTILTLTLGIALLPVFALRATPDRPPNTSQSQKLFKKANKLYKKGQFQAAMELYKTIPNKSAYVHYNLGNCAYKLQQHGFALLHWRRAEKNWGFFNRKELIENIALVKQQVKKSLGIEVEEQNPIIKGLSNLNRLLVSWVRTTPLLILQLLFLLLWLFLFVYARFLYKRRKKMIITTLFTLIALFGILLVVRYSIDSRRYGVVVSPQARLLSGPKETYQTLMQLPQAQEVVIKQDTKDYFKVNVMRRLGWVSKKNVEEI